MGYTQYTRASEKDTIIIMIMGWNFGHTVQKPFKAIHIRTT